MSNWHKTKQHNGGDDADGDSGDAGDAGGVDGDGGGSGGGDIMKMIDEMLLLVMLMWHHSDTVSLVTMKNMRMLLMCWWSGHKDGANDNNVKMVPMW